MPTVVDEAKPEDVILGVIDVNGLAQRVAASDEEPGLGFVVEEL